ncbi:MAG: hypothetical protein K8H86_14335 [Ignavibacteriaceae bacterium]|nr:hypothetical protein [Ignavibacteriaceae bacterium]
MSFLYPQVVTVKSLQAYTGKESDFPVFNGSNPLSIEFDVQSDFEPFLTVIFRFCDKNWIPTKNIFLLNQGGYSGYDLDYYTLPATVKDARYHVKGTFPDVDGYVAFPFSGKWRFYITDSQDTTKIYEQGKFFVVVNEVKLNTNIKNELLEDETFFPTDLAKVFNITSEFFLPDEFFPNFVDELEIIENHKIEYPIIIDRNFNTNRRQFYWNGNRKFSFTARDIRPGNEYRQTDIRDFNKFGPRETKAQFDGLEYSRFYKQAHADLNGGSVLANFKNDYSEYLDVTFSIKPPNTGTNKIFLIGAFNNWQVLPEYEMTDDYGVFKKTISLKRGIYDYQYVTADVINDRIKNIDWYALEGNSYETINEYYLFLYYKDPNYGGYDRIIGYNKILSRTKWKN